MAKKLTNPPLLSSSEIAEKKRLELKQQLSLQLNDIGAGKVRFERGILPGLFNPVSNSMEDLPSTSMFRNKRLSEGL